MRLHTDFQLRNIGTFYFLVPLKSDHPVIDQILTLNETGAFLWNSLQKILQKQHTVQPKKATADNALLPGNDELMQLLCHALQAEYDVTKDEVLPDVKTFLNSLTQKGILTLKD